LAGQCLSASLSRHHPSLILKSDAGGGNPVYNATVRFSDAASAALPQSAAIVTGVYKPANYSPDDLMPVPAPLGPYASSLAAFIGSDPNGTWSLLAETPQWARRLSIRSAARSACAAYVARHLADYFV
jgi:hypothetical protein